MVAAEIVSEERRVIEVGDVWEAYRSAHRGWRIRITKVGNASAEFHLLKSHGSTQREGRGRSHRYHLLCDVINRDFNLLWREPLELRRGARVETAQSTEQFNFTGPVLPAGEGIPARSVAHKICTQCGVLKPITDYDHYTGKAALAQPEGRLGICHPCVVEKRAKGIRQGFERRRLKQEADLTAQTAAQQEMIDRELAAIEEREQKAAAAAEAAAAGESYDLATKHALARTAELNGIAPPEPAPPAPPTPAPNPTPNQPSRAIAMTLLGLAAEVDAIEHPPAYRQLWSVVAAAMKEGTEAGAVFVIPADNYMALMIALEGSDKDFIAPAGASEAGEPSPNGGRPPEANWRKVLRDMQIPKG